jgi:hypothetical protein
MEISFLYIIVEMVNLLLMGKKNAKPEEKQYVRETEM